ncbi:MAG: alanine racemase [Natronospirillum sp.]|uniref:alanine racemase n=1 Tax=Natronospirillum sp. TaxID=2812955 RepID=UPI0025D349E8|nr:alanine racemase [Natronospirillum sp.]MCH8550719.1 alanine racemase [Natronospirillum sp.]
MSRGTCVTVHLDNLRHNLRTAQAHAPDSRVWAVVKANAYGHGLVPVARTLAPLSDGLAVATLDEALCLREAGLSGPVMLLEGTVSATQTEQALARNLELVLHHPEQIAWLAACQVPAPVRVWLKIDTGMHRLGVMPDQAPDLIRQLQSLSQVEQVATMTHFARADDPEHDMTITQAELLNNATLPGCATSLANSAGVLFWPGRQGDWVRPGIMLYGATPAPGRSAAELGLRAGMTLTAPIIALRDLQPGEAVGYGGAFKVEKPMRLATVAMGYADGYPRHAPNGTPAAVRGQPVTLAGRVSMDMLTVDVTSVPEAALGDPVELWGEQVPVDEVAQASGTIGYELLARLSVRGEVGYSETRTVQS